MLSSTAEIRKIRQPSSAAVLSKTGARSFTSTSWIENDNVNVRLEKVAKYRTGDAINPEVEWCGDGIIMLTMMPCRRHVGAAEAAAVEIGKKLGLVDPEVISSRRSCRMRKAPGLR